MGSQRQVICRQEIARSRNPIEGALQAAVEADEVQCHRADEEEGREIAIEREREGEERKEGETDDGEDIGNGGGIARR
eukprot:802824-Pyramimonas_sp.AAC.1